MKLYWYWSTNPQKIRLALEELGLDYELVEVDLFSGAHKKSEYLEISPRGKVPALETDGAVLWDSGAILAYLAGREKRLWPGDPSGQAKALNLLFLESGAFQDPAGAFFWERVVLPKLGKPGDPERLAKCRKKLEPLFQILSDHLGDQDYLLGDFSLVDCAYAPWLPVLDLDEYPQLAAWRTRLQARPSWEACQFPY